MIWRKAVVKGGTGLEEVAVWTKAVIGGRGLEKWVVWRKAVIKRGRGWRNGGMWRDSVL